MQTAEYRRSFSKAPGFGNTHHTHPCIMMQCDFYKKQRCTDTDPRYEEICRYSKYWEKEHEEKY
jgi:hypothetical protein